MTSMLDRAGRSLMLAALCASALALGGCSESRSFDWTFAPPLAGVGLLGPAVDIENDHGSVELRIEPWRKDIEVEMKTKIPGEMTGSQRDEVAEAFKRSAEVTEEQGPAVLVVRSAAAQRGGKHFTKVLVRMPEMGGARIRNAGGDVLVVGGAGAVQIENADGNVEWRTDQPVDAPVLLSTTTGNIRLQMPTSSRAALEAKTQDGKVLIDNWAKGQSDWSATWLGEQEVMGTINGGQNSLKLLTTDGDIKLFLLEDPYSRAGLWW